MKNKTLTQALDAYYDHFHDNYPLMITDMKTDAEIIADIEKCIESNKKAPEPEYIEGADY